MSEIVKTYERNAMGELLNTIDYYTDEKNVCRRGVPEKPVKPEEVLMSLPEDVERHILDFSGHNKDYKRKYIDWIFEKLSKSSNTYWNFYNNAKHYFVWSYTEDNLEWKGEARDLVKEMLKKQIDELTQMYNQI
jgi:hypothetical protein